MKKQLTKKEILIILINKRAYCQIGLAEEQLEHRKEIWKNHIKDIQQVIDYIEEN